MADVSYVSENSTTPLPPPKPYSFQYEAERHPGYIDRVHQETGDEHGIIHGNHKNYNCYSSLEREGYKLVLYIALNFAI